MGNLVWFVPFLVGAIIYVIMTNNRNNDDNNKDNNGGSDNWTSKPKADEWPTIDIVSPATWI